MNMGLGDKLVKIEAGGETIVEVHLDKYSVDNVRRMFDLNSGSLRDLVPLRVTIEGITHEVTTTKGEAFAWANTVLSQVNVSLPAAEEAGR